MPDASQTLTSDTERAELEQLSTRLATRHSVTHYAVAFVASFVGTIAAGIAVKLGVDRNFVLSSASGVLALVCLGLSVGGFWKGQRLKSQEHEEYRRLKELRAKAGLD
ncbi:MAG: hypothetical protein QM765_01935 [Myxococcales bacterium]